MKQQAREGSASIPSDMPAGRVVGDGQGRSALVGLALVLTSAAGYGSQAIFARLAYTAGANVATVLLLRFVLAIVVLWAILLLGKRGKRAWAAIKQPKRLCALLALGILFSGNSIAFFTALTYLHTAVVELLLYLYPGVVLVLAALFFARAAGAGEDRCFAVGCGWLGPDGWAVRGGGAAGRHRREGRAGAGAGRERRADLCDLYCAWQPAGGWNSG